MTVKTYTTRQGQTVDLVCLAHYGKTAGVTEMVLENNHGLADLGPVLPIGTIILLPEAQATETAPALVSLWS